MKPFDPSEEELDRMSTEIQSGGYLRTAIEGDNLSHIIKNVTAEAKTLYRGFDAIAFRGISGALVAPAVAANLKKNLIIVRKSTTDTVSDYLVEGHRRKQRYIIIDDMISSGDTIRAIKRNIKRSLNPQNEHIATILWKAKTPLVSYGGKD
jgi:adenine/guanine phosphoribosyltransferase-like PRPP-binding protein